MPKKPNIINTMNMTAARKTPFPEARLAISLLPLPRFFVVSTFTPTPVPMLTATISICRGNARVSALRAASPFSAIFDTNALSTMLYTAWSIIEITIGMLIESISLPTGSSAIFLVLSI